MPLLAHQERIHRLPVQNRPEEDGLTMLQISYERLEHLLRRTRIMHRKLACHQIPFLNTLELRKIRGGRRLVPKHDLEIPRLLLLERLRHIRLCEQDLRQELVRPLLLVQVTHTRSLSRHIDVGRRDIQPQHFRGLGAPPLV